MTEQGFEVQAMNRQMSTRLLAEPAPPLAEGGYTIRVLEVPGRRTGREHQTPVGVLSHAGGRYLICPDRTRDWAENVRAAGMCTLRGGELTESYAAVEVHDRAAAEAVAAYLGVVTVAWAVAAFGLPNGATIEQIIDQVDRMAVFSLDPRPAS